jgi:hypothetical protein
LKDRQFMFQGGHRQPQPQIERRCCTGIAQANGPIQCPLAGGVACPKIGARTGRDSLFDFGPRAVIFNARQIAVPDGTVREHSSGSIDERDARTCALAQLPNDRLKLRNWRKGGCRDQRTQIERNEVGGHLKGLAGLSQFLFCQRSGCEDSGDDKSTE